MPLTAYDLTGRTAFVTGAASGIGRATAVLLAEAGATVHCADLDEQGLDETADAASTTPAAPPTPTPSTSPTAPRSRPRRAPRRPSAPASDVMAAIAGIMHSSPVLETRDEDLDRVLAVNFKGVLYACQEAARADDRPRAPGARIVTMASGAVDAGDPGLLCYGVGQGGRGPADQDPGRPKSARTASASTRSPRAGSVRP